MGRQSVDVMIHYLHINRRYLKIILNYLENEIRQFESQNQNIP